MSHITIVDDDAALRMIVRWLLEDAGHIVTEARTGREAIDLLDDETAQVDLLLLDLRLPFVDGPHVAHHARTEPRWSRLPIIILTAGSVGAAESEPWAADVDGFLQKPFDLDEVSDLIAATLASAGQHVHAA